MVGLYKVKEVRLLLEMIAQMLEGELTTHGEYQLTDALMLMVDQGVKLSTINVDNWYNCGKKGNPSGNEFKTIG